MRQKREYTAADPMSTLVEGNYHALLVMSRFGIGLGFGDDAIGKVCADHGVDADTFLAVVNLTSGGGATARTGTLRVSATALVDYLVSSHDYFLGFRLPAIRSALAEVLDNPQDDLARAVMRFFDEYVEEVRRHMKGEERTLFPHVRALARGECPAAVAVHHDRPAKTHDRIEMKLSEFKRTLIKYYPARSTNRLNSVLFDIFNCEYDMASHNEVEDLLLAPVLRELERKNAAEL